MYMVYSRVRYLLTMAYLAFPHPSEHRAAKDLDGYMLPYGAKFPLMYDNQPVGRRQGSYYVCTSYILYGDCGCRGCRGFTGFRALVMKISSCRLTD